MMDWQTGQYIQLIIALSAGVILFVATYAVSMRIVVWTLLLMIPFQIIDGAYGSSNLVFTYMVGVSFILRGRFVHLPLLGIVIFIMFSYLLSFSQAPRGTSMDHILYLIMIISDFIIFYITYNYVRTSGNYRDMWNILAILNLLVLIYCVVLVIVGSSGVQIFGITELDIGSRREEQGYFSGPFRSVGNFADYMAVQTLISIYALMRFSTFRMRSFWFLLLAGNMAFMVAAGSRGGVVALVIGLMVFLFLFRKELGMRKMLTWLATGSLVFAIAAYVITQFTAYNVLFEKFEGTEFDRGVPDTRQGWFEIWDQVVEKPVFGHGPRLRLRNEQNRRIPGYTSIPYPHNAYMYLVATVGLVGLSAYLWFFSALARQYRRGGGSRAEDPLLRGLPLLGLAILILFAASQMHIEMFRFTYHDYQQYMFMLFGAFLAFSHLVLEQKLAEPGKSGEAHDGKGRLLSRAGKAGESVTSGN